MTTLKSHLHPSPLRALLESEAAGGLVLMFAAALALVVANSPLAGIYASLLHAELGPMSLAHWINDGLMAVFFLLVGLEIKREMLEGQLATMSRRVLPGIAAAGGMAVPALIYVAFNRGSPETLPGWAIPTATDIAFALGVLSLLGPRVPASLKVFLAALAIIDDLGAVVIIALFYTAELSLPYLGLAALVLAVLIAMNKGGVTRLLPYLLLGAVLWFVVLRSGVHATISGVLLALTIPLKGVKAPAGEAPLLRLEAVLMQPVAFIIVPLFGFSNAGVSLMGLTASALTEPLTLGVSLGLLLGKVIGVFGSASLAIRLGIAAMPMGARWVQLFGVALLCGIGFTMSLFVGLLAFEATPLLQSEVKLGILLGSGCAGLLGWLVLRATCPRPLAA
jgi:NhaA family Na+:H+ antiporter